MSNLDGFPEQFGRYRIVRKLGAGGMGSVYLAEDTLLSRRVALKVPHFGASESATVLERFRREARAAASIEHPNICPVHDVGEVDGVHYLVMPYIEGTPLSRLRQAEEPWPPEQAAALVRRVAEAVAVLHQRGVIHRDLKPGNIMIRPDGEPVLMDFGLVRSFTGASHHLTATGTSVGTPGYVSPEQVRGDKDIGPPTDVYSLGVILYELLTGHLPFEGPPVAVYVQVLYTEPDPPSVHRPGLNKRLEAICLKAMAKQAAHRFASAAELAAALEHCVDRAAVTMRPASRGPGSRAPETFRQSRPDSPNQEMRRQGEKSTRREARDQDKATERGGENRTGTRPRPLKVQRDNRVPARCKDDLTRQQKLALAAGGIVLALLFVAVVVVALIRRAGKNEVHPDRGAPVSEKAPADKKEPEPDPRRKAPDEGPTKRPPDRPAEPPVPVVQGRFRWLDGELDGPRAVAFSGDGQWVASADTTLRIWNTQTGKETFRLDGLPARPASIALGPGGKTVAANWDGQTVRTWEVPSKKQLHDRPGPVLSADGGLSLVLDRTGADVHAQVWDVAADKRIARFFISSRNDEALSLPGRGAFSLDGGRVAAHSGSGSVAVFDLGRKEIVGRVEANLPNGAEIALSSDGKRLLACLFQGPVTVWDVDQGKEVCRLEGHAAKVVSVTISRDGTRILSAGLDGMVRLWDAGTGKQLTSFHYLKGIGRVAFSPDGKRAAVAAADRVGLWDLPPTSR